MKIQLQSHRNKEFFQDTVFFKPNSTQLTSKCVTTWQGKFYVAQFLTLFQSKMMESAITFLKLHLLKDFKYHK